MSNGKSDESQTFPSIFCGLNDAAQLLSALNNSTPELQSVLTQECNIIYECRVCRSLFRGLINFLTHKRVHCKTSAAAAQSEWAEKARNNLIQNAVELLQPGTGSMNACRSSVNLVNRIAKHVQNKIVNDEQGMPLLHLHTLPAVAKAVPLTQIECGVQIICSGEDRLQSKEPAEENRIVMVLPEAAGNYRHSLNMQLRNKLPQKRCDVAKFIDINEPAVYDRLAVFEQLDLNTLLCQICDRSFPSVTILAFHCTTVHPQLRLSTLKSSAAVCLLCGKRFNTRSGLQGHCINVHRKEMMQHKKLFAHDLSKFNKNTTLTVAGIKKHGNSIGVDRNAMINAPMINTNDNFSCGTNNGRKSLKSLTPSPDKGRRRMTAEEIVKHISQQKQEKRQRESEFELTSTNDNLMKAKRSKLDISPQILSKYKKAASTHCKANPSDCNREPFLRRSSTSPLPSRSSARLKSKPIKNWSNAFQYERNVGNKNACGTQSNKNSPAKSTASSKSDTTEHNFENQSSQGSNCSTECRKRRRQVKAKSTSSQENISGEAMSEDGSSAGSEGRIEQEKFISDELPIALLQQQISEVANHIKSDLFDEDDNVDSDIRMHIENGEKRLPNTANELMASSEIKLEQNLEITTIISKSLKREADSISDERRSSTKSKNKNVKADSIWSNAKDSVMLKLNRMKAIEGISVRQLPIVGSARRKPSILRRTVAANLGLTVSQNSETSKNTFGNVNCPISISSRDADCSLSNAIDSSSSTPLLNDDKVEIVLNGKDKTGKFSITINNPKHGSRMQSCTSKENYMHLTSLSQNGRVKVHSDYVKEILASNHNSSVSDLSMLPALERLDTDNDESFYSQRKKADGPAIYKFRGSNKRKQDIRNDSMCTSDKVTVALGKGLKLVLPLRTKGELHGSPNDKSVEMATDTRDSIPRPLIMQSDEDNDERDFQAKVECALSKWPLALPRSPSPIPVEEQSSISTDVEDQLQYRCIFCGYKSVEWYTVRNHIIAGLCEHIPVNLNLADISRNVELYVELFDENETATSSSSNDTQIKAVIDFTDADSVSTTMPEDDDVDVDDVDNVHCRYRGEPKVVVTALDDVADDLDAFPLYGSLNAAVDIDVMQEGDEPGSVSDTNIFDSVSHFSNQCCT